MQSDKKLKKGKAVIVPLFFVLCILILLILAARNVNSGKDGLGNGNPLEAIAKALGAERKTTVLIDPGHGGIDGGAESAYGICEKNINLQIGMMLRDILEKYNICVKMTRETDKGLYSEDSQEETGRWEKRSIRSMKAEDLNARHDMAEDIGATIFVSIHLNSFKENRQVYGAQTFFAKSDDIKLAEKCRMLGELVQASLVKAVDNGNTRVALPKNDVIIMQDIKIPTVIVECGFLSNSSEATLLNTSDYQHILAEAIAKGVLDFLGIDPNNNNNQNSRKTNKKIIDSRNISKNSY